MQIIKLSSGLYTFYEDLVFLESTLLAHPLAVQLAPAVTAKIKSYDEIEKLHREARRDIIKAMAQLTVRNIILDDDTKELGVEALAECKGDRKSAFFRRFFNAVPSIVVRLGLREQVDYTKTTILPELAKQPEGSRLKPFEARLAEDAKEAERALTKRKEVAAARSGVAIDVDEWKKGANVMRETIFAELVKIGAERGGRAWADSFFRPSKRGSASAEVEGGEAEPEAETPA